MIRARRLVVIVGPTAVGKTELAFRLAKRIGAEIVSADSRQIYRYMDIGTAKPTPEQRKAVKHHFIDIVNPDERYTAGDYGQQARSVIRDLFCQNQFPVVVGGSGFYIRALLDGLFHGPRSDPKVKEGLIEKVKRLGSNRLHQELMRIDSEAAGRIHPNDIQRIVRALEVYQLTGKPISRLQRESPQGMFEFEPIIIGLTMERTCLYQRIDKRVDDMISKGLIEEVKKLEEMGYGRDLNSLNTVGYKEIFPLLDGEARLEETVDRIKKNSRRYAKRQLTWFRRDPRIKWTQVRDQNLVVEEILRIIESST
nr:tRNA (adenosine(37)-N6)-dimethylallyltransferase MiaA [Desulfobacterales bacterium]